MVFKTLELLAWFREIQISAEVHLFNSELASTEQEVTCQREFEE